MLIKFYDEYDTDDEAYDFRVYIDDMLISKSYNGKLTTEVRYTYNDYYKQDDERYLYFDGIPTTQDIIDRICDKEELK